MDPQWTAMLRRTLRHTVTVVPTKGQDVNAKPLYGQPEPNILCNIVDIPLSRVATLEQQGIQVSVEVWFSGQIPMGIKYKLQNGKDRWGVLKFTEAVVVRIDDTDHPEFGNLMTVAFCQPQ